ncbi:MAG: class I SAM-dependent methyltransferase [Herbiconiux sp.]|nr:class I SAM-dependent methyltransferase [Herbiconiux sp.]
MDAHDGTSIDPHGGNWLEDNRASWDERVPLHLEGNHYDQSALIAGHGRLRELEEQALARMFPDGFEGLRVLHLQCHFGADSLVFAQRGAEVVGLDFSPPAVKAARELAASVGLADRARFVIGNVYDARHLLPQPASFDLVYTSWGTIGWLPDVAEWARVAAWFVVPGGRFYFADSHPTAWVFDSAGSGAAVAESASADGARVADGAGAVGDGRGADGAAAPGGAGPADGEGAPGGAGVADGAGAQGGAGPADASGVADAAGGAGDAGALPRFAYPYDDGGVPTVLEEQGDYADESAVLENVRTWEWTHPLSSTLGALLDAGLRLDRLDEHYELPWRMFAPLEEGPDGMWRWPAERWLPLGLSLEMTLPAAPDA